MNKFTLLIIAIAITLTSYSQDFESGDINKKSYVRVGYSSPLYTNYGFTGKQDMSDNLDAFMVSKNADYDPKPLDSRIGAIFEIGTIFPLNKINIGSNMRFGINVDWLTVRAHVFKLEGSQNLYNLFVASKIGPSFTYAPAKAVAIDVYAKISPVWAGGVYYNHQDGDGNIDVYRGFVQLMYSTGVNVKFGFFMVGFEYDFGGMRLKNSEGTYFGNAKNDNKRTPLSGFSATIGVTF